MIKNVIEANILFNVKLSRKDHTLRVMFKKTLKNLKIKNKKYFFSVLHQNLILGQLCT